MPPDRKTPTGTSATRWARTRVAQARRAARRRAPPTRSRAHVARAAPGARRANAPHLDAARPTSSRWPAGSLRDVAVDRQRRRDRVEREVRLERVGVELAREAGRGAAAPSAPRRTTARRRAARVVQRLDAEAVAGEHEPARARVPQRDREHAAQPLDEAGAVLLVEVRRAPPCRSASRKRCPRASSSLAQLGVVVDLAVLRRR